MLFNSYAFIFGFLPVVLIGFYVLGARRRDWALLWLTLASLFFYAWWRPINVLLIAPSILINLGLARLLERYRESRPAAARVVLVCGIAFNLCFLGYFKYTMFLRGAVNDVFGTDLVLSHIILPLGISFITFQKIAFLADVYAGRVTSFTFRDYALFVLFFPQLIAGPIVHYREMMPQFRAISARFNTEDASVGVTLFFIGLAKKLVLADPLALVIAPLYARAAHGEGLGFVDGWIAALGFTLQIYFDFSGYTDMALGVARFFGIRLPMNFNSPLRATSIIEFWQRWHVSLTRFLTAYIYNPLSLYLARRRMASGKPGFGGRDTTVASFLTLLMMPAMITMFVSGLWHGAGYTYIVWGLMHGVMLSVNHAWRLIRPRIWPRAKDHPRLLTGTGFALTFVSVVIAMVMFRASGVRAAWSIWGDMIGVHGVTLPGGLLARFGSVGGWLNGIGVKADATSGSQIVEGVSRVAVLLAIALGLPNTLRILAPYEPALGVRPAKQEPWLVRAADGLAAAGDWSGGDFGGGYFVAGSAQRISVLAVLMVSRSRFLATWSMALVVMLVLAAGFNAAINPYELFPWQRIAGINGYKPGTRNHVALAKAYQVERARPVTVILGSSRVYYVMNAASPLWPEADRPVYNYGIVGSNLSQLMFRELRQAWGTGRLRHAVAILDVPAFLAPDPPDDHGPDERRLKFLDDGTINPDRNSQYFNDAFLSVLTMGALIDSVKTVMAREGDDTVLDLRSDGTANPADFIDVVRAEGVNALFTQKDVFDLSRANEFKRALADWNGPMPNIARVREMIQFCLDHDVSLTLILGPTHADQMEIYRQTGLWPYIERLKVDLAKLVAEAHSPTITAWDFVEYAPYTTETVPPPGDRAARLRWFWEPVHFQRALGEVMLQRVFQGTPADFGAPLTVATVEARNRLVRDQQRDFIGWRLACEANRQFRCTPPAKMAVGPSRTK